MQTSEKLLQNFNAEEGEPLALTAYESTDAEIIDLAKKIQLLQKMEQHGKKLPFCIEKMANRRELWKFFPIIESLLKLKVE